MADNEKEEGKMWEQKRVCSYCKKEKGGEDLGLVHKNKKGNPKADEHVLKGIKTPICKMILKYRNMQKLRKTYAGNYIKKAGDGDIVHPKLNSIGTVSGRYSSDSQQIPKEK